MNDIPMEFLQAVPKTDLHVHLDGSLRLSSLVPMAKEAGVALPSHTVSGLRDTVFKERYGSLGEYLRGFDYTVAVLQQADPLKQAAYELAEDNLAEGVRYLEVRFAPQLHTHVGFDIVSVLTTVNDGLKQARDRFNARPEIKDGHEPPFEYGIICCAMRMFHAGFSAYYRSLLQAHRFAPPKEVFRLASLELARAAVIARDEHGLPIVGFDLAGEEAGYPAGDHNEAFGLAHKHFLKKTVHAGEAYGPESIFQAITELHAERIGHGTYLLEPGAITDASIADKDQYVEQIGQFIADRRITLEVCLTSNLQTNPHMQSLDEHTFKKLRSYRLSTTICTDNRTVSNTTVSEELMRAVKTCGMSRRELKSIIIYGFKRSFFPGSYLRKRAYVRQVIDYYATIERRFFGEAGPAPGFEGP